MKNFALGELGNLAIEELMVYMNWTTKAESPQEVHGILLFDLPNSLKIHKIALYF